LGYSQQEALNFNPNDIVHPDDLPHVMRELELALKNPAMPISVTPARMRHKNGSWRWFDGTITNMIQDPAIGGIVDNFRDITDLVETEAQLSRCK
jgi:PAS domain S-box-containing protein